jgi:hypothetical protein
MERRIGMTWNHRVFHEVVDGEEWFTIREAYYDADKETPHSWTEDGVAPCGNNLAELRAELERMLRACEKPVLAIAAAGREWQHD